MQNNTVHQSKISEIFKSKKEMWRFMSGSGNCFLPNCDNVHISFLQEIFSGKKKFVLRSNMKKAYLPQIDGLYIKDLIKFIQDRQVLHDYFPKEEEIAGLGKDFIANILSTICEDEFNEFVQNSEKERRQRIDEKHNLNIPIVDQFKDKLFDTSQISQEHGKAHHLIKIGTKRKRTQKELDQVKQTEILLKQDKQKFLLEFQDLQKRVNIKLEDMEEDKQQYGQKDQIINESQQQINQMQKDHEQTNKQLINQTNISQQLQQKIMLLYEKFKDETGQEQVIQQIFQDIVNEEQSQTKSQIQPAQRQQP